MCGINGFISEEHSDKQREEVVKRMNTTLAHRGPDNEGLWSGSHISLGHRRLSIIDLSAESNQPFFSNDGRYVIVYNGELYNYRELKLELQRSAQGSSLQPYFFKTNSDTEVILASFIRWGLDCFDHFIGMYAMAIFDTQTKKLIIARDRLGVKPLYYSYSKEGFLFSSEIRPILRSGIKTFTLNRDALPEYTMYQTVFAPNTIIKGVKVLMPGHYMEVADGTISVTQYYSGTKFRRNDENLSYKETCNKINELLSLSVQRRLVADVPFGAFLSGGIDSSVIVSLMSKVSTEKVRTFNISFDESEFSESRFARMIAKKFNTLHHEIKLTPQDFLRELPEALSAIDHPGGDGPNTYIVSKATKNAGVTMALSGVGGDELFAGYDVFKRMTELKNKAWMNSVPLFARKSAGYLIKKQRKSVKGNKIEELLGQKEINFNTTYPLNRSLFTEKEVSLILKSGNPFSTIQEVLKLIPQRKEHLLSAVSVAEINTYLQNILLRDADQMGMSVALEIREPFLDHQLLEFVLGIDDKFKYPHSPKKLLVDSVGDLLPREIVDRPKMGFTLPWQHWLKNDLKSFCESNIASLENKNLFVEGSLKNLWHRYLNYDPGVTWSRVWHLVTLNNWLEENRINT